jgi:hypothetical protein
MTLSAQVLDEYDDAVLPDKRLKLRLRGIVAKAARCPNAGFPRMLKSDTALEGLYRFLNNPRVTFEALLQPHFDATLSRVGDTTDVLAIHDTTKFVFSGEAERRGLGRTTTGGQGFDAHFALAVSSEKTPRPLGVLGIRTIFRDRFAYRKRRRTSGGTPTRPRNQIAGSTWSMTSSVVPPMPRAN